jgi:hypothetical protein
MPFIEVKATDYAGRSFPSKAAMKRAIVADPNRVRFTSVATLGPTWTGSATDFLTDGPAGVKLTVVGPDPYTDRKWYGTVEVKNGQLKAS